LRSSSSHWRRTALSIVGGFVFRRHQRGREKSVDERAVFRSRRGCAHDFGGMRGGPNGRHLAAVAGGQLRLDWRWAAGGRGISRMNVVLPRDGGRCWLALAVRRVSGRRDSLALWTGEDLG